MLTSPQTRPGSTCRCILVALARTCWPDSLFRQLHPRLPCWRSVPPRRAACRCGIPDGFGLDDHHDGLALVYPRAVTRIQASQTAPIQARITQAFGPGLGPEPSPEPSPEPEPIPQTPNPKARGTGTGPGTGTSLQAQAPEDPTADGRRRTAALGLVGINTERPEKGGRQSNNKSLLLVMTRRQQCGGLAAQRTVSLLVLFAPNPQSCAYQDRDRHLKADTIMMLE